MTRYTTWVIQLKSNSSNANRANSSTSTSFPAAIAQAMDFAKAEDVEWTISDKKHLILSRKVVPPDPVDVKKTLHS
jgi:hypothetical protein